MNWVDYREKLGIGFNNDQKFKTLFVRVFNILRSFEDTVYGSLDVHSYIEFCNTTGIELDPRLINDNYDFERFHFCLEALYRHDSTLSVFLAYYVAFMNSVPKSGLKVNRENYKNILVKALDDVHLSFDLLEENEQFFIFPKGAPELDDALVSEPLDWLSDYPQAHKTFIIALKQYSEGVYIRDVADNLRKALEAFLQEFLENDKNLENNKNEICRYLGSQGVDAGISGLFQPLINAYKNINDRIVKHNDAVDAKLLEFLLYQTGLLIRMVLVVKQSNT